MLTKERAEELSKPLHEELEYHSLKLSGKSFGVDAAQAIEGALRKQKNLKNIVIADIIAGRPEEEALKALEIIGVALQHTDPTIIDISDNAFGKKGIHSLRTLIGNKKNIEEFYINNNGLDTEALELIQELLLHETPTKLRIVNCINNLLRDGGGKAMAAVVAASPCLENLIVTATRIGPDGGTDMARALCTSATNRLQILDLSDNNFNKEGRKLLAKALKDQPYLTSINLASTSLEDDGVIRIVNALSETAPDLEVLNLAANEATADTVEAIIECIKDKPSLRVLRLEDNELGSDGVKEIAAALSTGHDELEEVDFSVNEVDDEAARELVSVLLNKKNMKYLNLKENEISEEAQEELKELVAKDGREWVFILTEEDEELQKKKVAEEELQKKKVAEEELQKKKVAEEGLPKEKVEAEELPKEKVAEDAAVSSLTEKLEQVTV